MKVGLQHGEVRAQFRLDLGAPRPPRALAELAQIRHHGAHALVEVRAHAYMVHGHGAWTWTWAWCNGGHGLRRAWSKAGGDGGFGGGWLEQPGQRGSQPQLPDARARASRL